MMGAIHQMERELRAERAAAGRASAQARGRPRTDVVKLRDAKVLYDNSGKTAEEVCKVRWRRQAHLLRLPCSTERSGLSSSHGQLDLFEGLGKNSLVLFDPGDPIPAQRRRVVTDKRFWSRVANLREQCRAQTQHKIRRSRGPVGEMRKRFCETGS